MPLLPDGAALLLLLQAQAEQCLQEQYIKMMLGVQLDDSDTSLCIKYAAASFTSSTAPPKSCAAAEMQFAWPGMPATTASTSDVCRSAPVC